MKFLPDKPESQVERTVLFYRYNVTGLAVAFGFGSMSSFEMCPKVLIYKIMEEFQVIL